MSTRPFIHAFIGEAFRVSLFTYLSFLVLDLVIEGFVTRFIDLTILLLGSGVLGVTDHDQPLISERLADWCH